MNYIHLNETIFQKGIAISLQALINISLGFISCSFQVDNVKEDNRLLGRFILMFEAAFRSP